MSLFWRDAALINMLGFYLFYFSLYKECFYRGVATRCPLQVHHKTNVVPGYPGELKYHYRKLINNHGVIQMDLELLAMMNIIQNSGNDNKPAAKPLDMYDEDKADFIKETHYIDGVKFRWIYVKEQKAAAQYLLQELNKHHINKDKIRGRFVTMRAWMGWGGAQPNTILTSSRERVNINRYFLNSIDKADKILRHMRQEGYITAK